MKRGSVLLCDGDRIYLRRLHGYLRERIRIPLGWQDFTDTAFLPAEPECAEKTVLVIAQTLAEQADLTAWPFILVLTEREDYETSPAENIRTGKNATLKCVSRYSRASDISDKLLELLGDAVSFTADAEGRIGNTSVIGYYSPLGRCMQTSAAITAGQILSADRRTLFIGFDAFPVTAFMAEERGVDLSDLLYYFGCDKSRLPVFIRRAIRRMGTLEYIPPASSIHCTKGVDGTEWLALIRAICAGETPDYLLLDLSGPTPGLFDILSVCDEIYTITGHDASDAAKIEAYKRWMIERGAEEILQKTVFCKMPKGCRLPSQPEMLSGSALADYLVKNGLLPGSCRQNGTRAARKGRNCA